MNTASVVSLAVHHTLNAKRLREIQSIIEEHKDEIVRAWKEHFGKR